MTGLRSAGQRWRLRGLLLALAAAIGLLGLLLLRNPWSRAWIKSHASHTFQARDELDESSASFLFDLPRIGGQFRYDPVAHLLFRPGIEQVVLWPEHPAGRFVVRTNELGLREDEPTAREKRGARILVAGDSHTAGLVSNPETFANRLEARLRARPGRADVEVLNAGVSFTGPHCYLGILEKFLDLQPDVFVAVLFTGNDFHDDLRVRYLLDGWSPPLGDEAYVERLLAAQKSWSGPVSQGFNQAYRWKHFPWEPEPALEAVIDSFLAMHARCAEERITFLAVVLPTKMDVEPEDDAEVQESVRAGLGLAPEDLAVDRGLAERFVAAMRAAGVRCLDPLEEMRAAAHPLYWRMDYHLSLQGHELLAELLERELASEL